MNTMSELHATDLYIFIYPFPLVAEAECADIPGLFSFPTALHLLVDST